MIEIEAPDGSIVEFPDGTPDNVMSSAMQKAFGGGKAAPTAPKGDGLWDSIKTQAGNAAQAADDIVRIGANAVTFGYADKLAAKGNATLGSGDYTKNLAQERAASTQAEDRAGSAGLVAKYGAPLLPGAAIAKGVSAAASGVRSVPGLGAMAANPFFQAGATGAVMGTADAAGNDKSLGAGAALGAGAGVVGQGLATGITKAISGAGGLMAKQPQVPSIEAIRASKDAAYKAADEAGVVYAPSLLNRAAKGIRQDLTDMAFLPANQPKIRAVLDEIDRVGTSNVTLKGIDAIRKAASGAYDPGNKASNAMISKIIDRIDEAVANPKPTDVIFGDAPGGAKALEEARKLFSQTAKYDKIKDALTRAERRAASTGSGGNTDNATRQNIRQILDNPSKSRGFTADEKAAMELVVRGTPGQNTARLLGKLSPQGNGLMAALGLGATVANPMMAAAPALGMVSKTIADKATPANVNTLVRIIQAGGKRSNAVAPPTPFQRLAKSERETLARILMGVGIGQIPSGSQ